jgi:bacterial/archaeal transporter family-2 protein
MSKIMLALITFCGGLAATIQPSINARLARHIGVIESASISFLVGTLVLIAVACAFSPGDFRGISGAPWWQLTGGLLGAFFVAVTTVAVPRIGTTATMALIISAQLIAGMVLDHFGMFGMRGAAIDLRRIVGAIILAFGVYLILKR